MLGWRSQRSSLSYIRALRRRVRRLSLNQARGLLGQGMLHVIRSRRRPCMWDRLVFRDRYSACANRIHDVGRSHCWYRRPAARRSKKCWFVGRVYGRFSLGKRSRGKIRYLACSSYAVLGVGRRCEGPKSTRGGERRRGLRLWICDLDGVWRRCIWHCRRRTLRQSRFACARQGVSHTSRRGHCPTHRREPACLRCRKKGRDHTNGFMELRCN